MTDPRLWYWVKYPYWKSWIVGFKSINLCGYFTLQWVDFEQQQQSFLEAGWMQTINNRFKQPAAQNTLMNHRIHPPTAGGIIRKRMNKEINTIVCLDCGIRVNCVCSKSSLHWYDFEIGLCACILSPGAGEADGLWRPWSRDSVQVPPPCRCSVRLHLELSCTPATPPLAGWSACSHKGMVKKTKKVTQLQAETLNTAHS